jgi:cytochrome c oxidase subunit 3
VNLVVATVALVTGILVWWLAARRLTTKSWEGQGTYDGRDAAATRGPGPARMGLWVFLGVVTSLFALFITAYFMRMYPHVIQAVNLRDWRPVTEPAILWFNTALLVAGSIGMQVAIVSIRRARFERASAGLLAGGIFAIAFLAGQWLAWGQLQAAGYYATGNPANAFFYVLTGLHGLHLLGGLVVWGWTFSRMSAGRTTPAAIALRVELCAVYWHYLLFICLVLFGVLLIT